MISPKFFNLERGMLNGQCRPDHYLHSLHHLQWVAHNDSQRVVDEYKHVHVLNEKAVFIGRHCDGYHVQGQIPPWGLTVYMYIIYYSLSPLEATFTSWAIHVLNDIT